MKKTTKKAAVKVPLYKDPKQPIEARVRDLLKRMTLEEKVLQLQQENVSKDVNPNNLGEGKGFNPQIGSILSYTPGVAARNKLQKAAVEGTRLGIPIIWGYDVIHGWRTCMPVSLAQAGSFNPALTEAGAEVAAKEAYYDGGVDWTFSPMVEVCHDPRWGRCVEGYGEDPFTSQRFTEACVWGYQGRTRKELAKPGRIAACLKHFVGYSASEGGRDYVYSDISMRALWEWYLPPFEAGVKAGAVTLMSSFNDITGVPAAANRYTMTDVLRGRWGFDGFIVSDWGGVSQLYDQGYTKDNEVKAMASLLAGNDMDMVDGVFKCLTKLVKDGALKMSDIDLAVSRVLRIKFACGLFEHPYAEEKPFEETCLTEASRKVALDAARETEVLIKNEKNFLPLPAKTTKTIAVVGPAVKNRTCHFGMWRGMVQDDPAYGMTLEEALPKAFPKAKFVFVEGCGFGAKDDGKRIPAAVAAAKKADIVIFAGGEADWMTGEYTSRCDLVLPGHQRELFAQLAKLGKPIVSLLVTGRPMVFPEVTAASKAVLYMWQSGTGAAQAAAEILSGVVNPSAKLAMTFPKCVGQVPVYYNMHHKSRRWASWYNAETEGQQALWDGPEYPFGYGLSYTTFEYSDLKIAKKRGGAAFTATVTVKNTGKKDGKETVIWYLEDPEAFYTQPIQRVIGFEKIELKAGESKTVTLQIDSERDLSYVTHEGTRVLEAGDFALSASNKLRTEFVL